MATPPGNTRLDLPTVHQTATWGGIPSITLKEGNEGPQIDLSGSTAIMTWRTDPNAPAVLTLTTDNGIEIKSDGTMEIPARIMDMPPGNYHFDMRLTLPDGKVIYPFHGRQTILSTISKPQ